MTTEDRILTLHPQGKTGVNILRRRYEVIRTYILDSLKTQQPMTFQALGDQAVADLSETFDGKVLWYITSVKLDLEARGEIERVPKTSPHQLRLP
ncbi:MAG: hypothetical protein AAF399_15810 [Bacteroidota bacterium]